MTPGLYVIDKVVSQTSECEKYIVFTNTFKYVKDISKNYCSDYAIYLIGEGEIDISL